MKKWNVNSAIRCIERNSTCKTQPLINVLGIEKGKIISINNRSAGLTVLGAADYLNKQTKENISVIFVN